MLQNIIKLVKNPFSIVLVTFCFLTTFKHSKDDYFKDNKNIVNDRESRFQITRSSKANG